LVASSLERATARCDHAFRREVLGDTMDTAMRDLGKLRERDETTGRKIGLFALSGALSVAAIIALGVVSGSSDERELTAARDPLEELALSADPKAPRPSVSPVQPPSVELERLSFPATLVGDEAVIQATVRAADAELAALGARTATRSRAGYEGARAGDIPANTLATDQALRLQKSAKHDPLIAQSLPERGEGSYAPHGSAGAFTLQVVSYEERDPAERFANALRARGHKAFVAQAEVPGRGRTFRVRVGPFTTRRDALDYQTRFEQSERMHSILVSGASN
jgi:cell division septation protein DedD